MYKMTNYELYKAKRLFYIMKSFIFIILLCSLLIPLTSAASLGTFQERSCINLIQTCSNCTYVNITAVYYPNSSIALSNVAMTKLGTLYNYTYCKTTVSGKYIVTGVGDLDASPTVWDYYFDITPAGINFNPSFYWLILALGFGLIVLGTVKEDYTITTLGAFALVYVGLYILFYGIADVKNTMSNAFGIIILAIAGYIMVKLGIDFMDGK